MYEFWGVQKIFPKFSQTCTKHCRATFADHFLARPPKMVFTCFSANVGRHFSKSTRLGAIFCPDLKRFCPNLRRFCSIFQGIYSDFQQIKVLGVRAPPFCQAPPASYTTVNDGYNILLYSFSFIIDGH